MIFIVEGPDGAGKTTFARQLGGVYHHEGPPPPGFENLFDYYYGKVRRAWAENGGQHGRKTVVFDRLALGEVVYGPLLRGSGRLTVEGYREFYSATKRLGAVHVLCLPPRSECYKNWVLRAKAGRELFTDDSLFDKTYDQFTRFAGLADVVFDYTKGDR